MSRLKILLFILVGLVLSFFLLTLLPGKDSFLANMIAIFGTFLHAVVAIVLVLFVSSVTMAGGILFYVWTDEQGIRGLSCLALYLVYSILSGVIILVVFTFLINTSFEFREAMSLIHAQGPYETPPIGAFIWGALAFLIGYCFTFAFEHGMFDEVS